MLLLLPCVTLCPFSQITRIMLQSLADIILRLVKGNILRNILSYLIPTQHNSLTLIGFLLRHNGLYGFGCELLFFKHLSHTDCLSWDGVQSFRSISSTKSRWQSSSRKESQRQVAFSFCPRPQGQAVRGQDWSSDISANLLTTFANFVAKTSFVRCRSKSDTTGVEFSFFGLPACLFIASKRILYANAFSREVSATFENCFPPLRCCFISR